MPACLVSGEVCPAGQQLPPHTAISLCAHTGESAPAAPPPVTRTCLVRTGPTPGRLLATTTSAQAPPPNTATQPVGGGWGAGWSRLQHGASEETEVSPQHRPASWHPALLAPGGPAGTACSQTQRPRWVPPWGPSSALKSVVLFLLCISEFLTGMLRKIQVRRLDRKEDSHYILKIILFTKL